MTSPILPYTTIAEICVKEHIRYLQLREKDIDDKSLLQVARDIKSITQGSHTKLIINDRADICLLCKADGLHLGQDDISIADARLLLPTDTIIGLSTHNLSQVTSSLTHHPDYIGFGPVYQTPTKKKPDPVVGCDMLNQALALANIPVVAIGGIDQTNIHHVVCAGAKNISLVRYFMSATSKIELTDKINCITDIIKKNTR